RYEVPLTGKVGKAAVVTATLYYQTIPPYYLRQRATDAKGIDTTRLQFYACGTSPGVTRLSTIPPPKNPKTTVFLPATICALSVLRGLCLFFARARWNRAFSISPRQPLAQPPI